MNTDTPAPSALPADSSKQKDKALRRSAGMLNELAKHLRWLAEGQLDTPELKQEAVSYAESAEDLVDVIFEEMTKWARKPEAGLRHTERNVVFLESELEKLDAPPPGPDKSAGGTARTDRFFTDLTDTGGAWGTKDAHKLADFARTLERELAQAQQSLAEANNQLGRAHEEYRNINHAYQQLSDDHRKRITDFLNEYQCCGGFECGCGGITRLQFLIEEQAGTQLDATRAQLKDLTDQFSALRARDNIGMSPGERIMEEIRTKAFDQSAYIKKCERLLRIAGNNANDSDEGIESFELRILELLKNSPIK